MPSSGLLGLLRLLAQSWRRALALLHVRGPECCGTGVCECEENPCDRDHLEQSSDDSEAVPKASVRGLFMTMWYVPGISASTVLDLLLPLGCAHAWSLIS